MYTYRGFNCVFLCCAGGKGGPDACLQRCPLSEERKEWVKDGTELGHVTHRMALAAAGYFRQDKQGQS